MDESVVLPQNKKIDCLAEVKAKTYKIFGPNLGCKPKELNKENCQGDKDRLETPYVSHHASPSLNYLDKQNFKNESITFRRLPDTLNLRTRSTLKHYYLVHSEQNLRSFETSSPLTNSMHDDYVQHQISSQKIINSISKRQVAVNMSLNQKASLSALNPRSQFSQSKLKSVI